MRIGEKIKELRLERGLTQDELANRCELSKGFISQLERDLVSPSVSNLSGILNGLGTTIHTFFQMQEEQIVFNEQDFYEISDTTLGYKVEWIIPNTQKNRMEPILLTIEKGGRYKEEQAHDGEEFGYVLEGSIAIYLGNKMFKVKKGESFYFQSGKTHHLENIGIKEAKLIWISTPPNF
ncbi:MAG: helix-turn-helix domain-containing protein [Brevinema sp.]